MVYALDAAGCSNPEQVPVAPASIAQRTIATEQTQVIRGDQRADIGVPIRFSRMLLGAIVVEGALCYDPGLLSMLESCALYTGARLDHDTMAQRTAHYQKVALTDALTGVMNRGGFEEALSSEWKRAERQEADIAMLMIDVDYFKSFNDHYGHQAGDLCLKQLARSLADEVHRPGDIFARYGGEEFVAVLPETNLGGAATLAERLLKRMEQLRLPHEGSSLGRVSISIGVAFVRAGAQTASSELLTAADTALYEAKRSGRNCLSGIGYATKTAVAPALPRTAVAHNLPLQLTRLVGRANEVSKVRQLLGTHRMVTISGMGGTGKTRLAIRTAAQCIHQFEEGTWFVDLAPLAGQDAIISTIASLFGICTPALDASLVTLTTGLRAKRALIILDNCEHVVGAIAQICSAVLASCTGVKILATSREVLQIAGEVVYKLPLLALPPPNIKIPPGELMRYDAVALFVERARAIEPTFEITATNGEVITEICRQLDGIALALELAATRLRVLSLEQLLKRLRQRFDLLTGGDRGALPRQQTMRTLIDWSFDLLSESERVLYRRLAIFAGAWTLDALLEVCADNTLTEDDVINGLSGLIGKSLVAQDGLSSENRYRLLETLRQYAEEKLIESGEVDCLSDRHAHYYLRIAQSLEQQRTVSGWRVSGAPRADLENFRKALQWTLERRHNVPRGAAIAVALGDYFSTCFPSEGIRWAQMALDLSAGDLTAKAAGDLCFIIARSDSLSIEEIRRAAERAVERYRDARASKDTIKALCALAQHLVWYFPQDRREAEEIACEALQLAREEGDAAHIGLALRVYGLAIQGTNLCHSRDLYHQSLEIFKSLNNDRQISGILMWLSELEFARGDIEGAIQHAREALRYAEASGLANHVSCAASNFAQFAAVAGDILTVARAAEIAARVAGEAGLEVFITWAVQAFAVASASAGNLEAAACLIGFCDNRIGDAHGPRQVGSVEKVLYARLMAQLQQRLSKAQLRAAVASGAALTVAEAFAFGLRVSNPGPRLVV